MMQIIECKSLIELQNWAEQFGAGLSSNAVILADGIMGCGKTTLAAALAKGIGIKQRITSPTFNKLNIYHGRPCFIHLDFYNIRSLIEIEELGIYDYLNAANNICFIEWWNLFPEVFPNICATQITIQKQDEIRTLTIKPAKSEVAHV